MTNGLQSFGIYSLQSNIICVNMVGIDKLWHNKHNMSFWYAQWTLTVRSVSIFHLCLFNYDFRKIEQKSCQSNNASFLNDINDEICHPYFNEVIKSSYESAKHSSDYGDTTHKSVWFFVSLNRCILKSFGIFVPLIRK